MDVETPNVQFSPVEDKIIDKNCFCNITTFDPIFSAFRGLITIHSTERRCQVPCLPTLPKLTTSSSSSAVIKIMKTLEQARRTFDYISKLHTVDDRVVPISLNAVGVDHPQNRNRPNAVEALDDVFR